MYHCCSSLLSKCVDFCSSMSWSWESLDCLVAVSISAAAGAREPEARHQDPRHRKAPQAENNSAMSLRVCPARPRGRQALTICPLYRRPWRGERGGGLRGAAIAAGAEGRGGIVNRLVKPLDPSESAVQSFAKMPCLVSGASCGINDAKRRVRTAGGRFREKDTVTGPREWSGIERHSKSAHPLLGTSTTIDKGHHDAAIRAPFGTRIIQSTSIYIFLVAITRTSYTNPLINILSLLGYM